MIPPAHPSMAMISAATPLPRRYPHRAAPSVLGAAFLLLTGCSTAQCVSPCGLELEFALQCSVLDEQEARALDAFAAFVPGWGHEHTCPKLKGWEVDVAPQADDNGAWTLKDGRQVLGLAQCDHKQIWVGNVDLQRTPLAHELAHAIQGCKGHEDWPQAGICKAIAGTVGECHLWWGDLL